MNGPADSAKHREPRRKTQQERSEATKKKLLRAAIKVLENKGYSKFTTSEVARVAKSSRGAQTHHFPSTQAFILAAIDHLYETLLKRTEQRVAAAMQSDELLQPVLADASDFLLGPEFLSIYNTLIEIGNGGAKEEVNEIGRRYRLPIEAKWSHYLIGKGVAPLVAENAVWTIFSTVRGLSIRRIFMDDPEHVQRTLDFVMEMVDERIRASM